MCFGHNGVHFSTSQVPKVVREWFALYILTWKCASRHNGIHFFMSHLTTWLRTRRFSEPTFQPSGATNHWKNTVNRGFPTPSRTRIFLLPTLSLLCSSHFLTSPPWLFPPLLFHLCILSEVSLLNFLRSSLPSGSQIWLVASGLAGKLSRNGTCSIATFDYRRVMIIDDYWLTGILNGNSWRYINITNKLRKLLWMEEIH